MSRMPLAAVVTLAVVAVLSPSTACPGQVGIFGKTYAREKKKPRVEIDSFAVSDPSRFFTLVVLNGRNGRDRVSSGTIWINGHLVVEPAALNQNVS